jgi:hypothetical protein
MAKHTLNGTRRKVIKTSGFRARLSTKVEENFKKSSTSWTLEISNFQITFCFFHQLFLDNKKWMKIKKFKNLLKY